MGVISFLIHALQFLCLAAAALAADAPCGWRLPGKVNQGLVCAPAVYASESLLKQTQVYRVVVPTAGLEPFVVFHNESMPSFGGSAIEVFQEVARKVKPSFSYQLCALLDTNTTYDFLADTPNSQSRCIDFAVGDITITGSRAQKSDFTDPFLWTPLVVLTRQERFKPKPRMWELLEPFSLNLWGLIAASCVAACVVLWRLELRTPIDRYVHVRDPRHVTPVVERVRDEHPRLRTSLGRIVWWVVNTFFFSQDAKGVQTLAGKFFGAVWLLLVLVLVSAYNASLTTLLTVRKLQPAVQSLEEVRNGTFNISILENSWYKEALVGLDVNASRIKNIDMGDKDYYSNYDRWLQNDTRNVIVDEFPYADAFLRQYGCEYVNVVPGIGSDWAWGGWGWAFPKGRHVELRRNLSAMILEGQKTNAWITIQRSWLERKGHTACMDSDVAATRLELSHFTVLFVGLAIVTVLVLVVDFARSMWTRKQQPELRYAQSGKSASLGIEGVEV